MDGAPEARCVGARDRAGPAPRGAAHLSGRHSTAPAGSPSGCHRWSRYRLRRKLWCSDPTHTAGLRSTRCLGCRPAGGKINDPAGMGSPARSYPRSWREHRSANPHPPPITDRRTPRSGGLLGMPRGAEVRAGQVEGNMASAGSLCSSRLYKGWSHRLGSPTDLDLASFLLGRKMAYGPQTQAESESDCLIKAPAWAAPWMGRPWVPRPWSHTESVAPSSRPSTGRAGQGSKKPSTS